MADLKQSMASQHSRNITICQVVSLAINVALLIVSHTGVSAVVKSSICAGEADCDVVPFTPAGLTDQCLDAPTQAQFSEGGAFYDNFTDIFTDIGLVCGLACFGNKVCLGNCLDNEISTTHPDIQNISSGCRDCLVDQIACTGSVCIAECLADPQSRECAQCGADKCDPFFEDCSGGLILPPYEFSDAENEPQDFEGCTPRGDLGITMYTVFSVFFVDSIAKSWEGGAYGLALVIAIASGFWPYMKNVLMALSWFMPMTEAKRDKILQWLAWLGKWSLVDVFAITLLLSGVRIDKILGFTQESALIVLTESRIAIYTFGTAALWALIQGEYIRHLGRQLKVVTADEKSAEKTDTAIEDKTETDGTGRMRLYLALTSGVSLVTLFVGLFTSNLSFELVGVVTDLPGPGEYSYTAVDLAVALVNKCALDGNESIPGTFYLAILFLLMGLLFPALCLICMFATATMDPMHKNIRKMAQLSRSLSYFAAIDVYFISLLVLISQFEGLINASLGEEVEERCPASDDGTPCLTFRGQLEFGTWIVLISCFFFVLAQVSLSYAYPIKLNDPYLILP